MARLDGGRGSLPATWQSRRVLATWFAARNGWKTDGGQRTSTGTFFIALVALELGRAARPGALPRFH